MSTLCNVKITSTTTFIASTAFDHCNNVMLSAPSNSYARTWAKEHNVPFCPIVMICASIQSSPVSVSILQSKEITESDSSSELRPENQWRRVEEINVIRTEKLIANHVQGRSPPMA